MICKLKIEKLERLHGFKILMNVCGPKFLHQIQLLLFITLLHPIIYPWISWISLLMLLNVYCHPFPMTDQLLLTIQYKQAGYLRNRKHFLYCYRLIETRGERVRNSKLRGNTRPSCSFVNAISSLSRVPRVFP